LSDWLLLVGSLSAINLVPAFGPPTRAVLVFFRLNSNLATVPLVLLGALAAASGRFVLANRRHQRTPHHPRRPNNPGNRDRGELRTGLWGFPMN
jgi:hypothetical protein